MPEPATLEERLQKLVEDHERRLRHLESLECPTVPDDDDSGLIPWGGVRCVDIIPPLGDFGLCNGQFECADAAGQPEDWEVNEDAGGFVMRAPGGACGNWCMMGGRFGVGTGGNIVSLRYIPVYHIGLAGRDYYIACAFISNLGVGDARLGVHCYTAARAFIATVWAVSVANVPVAWTWYQRKVGPNGDVQFPVGTRYIRVVVELQYDAGVADIVYVDDVQFQQMKMAYSPGIRLIANRINVVGPQAVTTTAFVLIAGSAITLTLEEPGYIWTWYRAVVVTNNVYRRSHYNVAIFQDGAQLGQVAQFGSLNPAFDTTVPVYDRSNLLAAGPHTMDLRARVMNAGDTATFYFIVGFAFYTRAY